MKDAKQPERMTLREFKFWLEGLLSGNDNPRDLPKRDQWQQIMTRIELIDDPATPQKSKPVTSGTVTISDGTTGLYLGNSASWTANINPNYGFGGINGSS